MTQAGLSLQLGISGGTTDRSGLIASSSVQQNVAAINLNRSWMFIQNPKANTNSLFVNFTAAASATLGAGSIELAPGATFEQKFPGFVTNEAVNLFGTATQSFVYKEA